MGIRNTGGTNHVSRNFSSGNTVTVMCWGQIVTDRNDYSTFFELSSGSNGLMQTLSNGTTLMYYDGSEKSGSALTVGTWYHLAVVQTGTEASNVTVYLDGASNITANGNTVNTIRFLTSQYGEPLNGRVAAAKIYSRALNAAEVQAEMYTFLPKSTTNLIGWFPFIDSQTIDYSGNAATLSQTGTVPLEDNPPISWGSPRRRIFLPAAAAADDWLPQIINF